VPPPLVPLGRGQGIPSRDRATEGGHVDVNVTPLTAIEPPFILRREDEGDVAVLVVEGEVDLVTAPALQKEFDSIAPGTSVVIDLCETPFMDSSGLCVLLAATRALDERVHIACVPGGPVRRLFEVALGKPGALKLFATRREALAAFKA
jgi:anti-anti-sigma factor